MIMSEIFCEFWYIKLHQRAAVNMLYKGLNERVCCALNCNPKSPSIADKIVKLVIKKLLNQFENIFELYDSLEL